MGSSTNNAFTKQVAFADRPTPKSTVKLQSCSAFQQVQKDQTSLQPIIQGKSDVEIANAIKKQAKALLMQRELMK